MQNVYIFGLGKGKQILDKCIRKSDIVIVGYIDNYCQLKELDGIPIINNKQIDKSIDKIIISLMKYDGVKEELVNLGVSENKIICFYSIEDVNNCLYWDVIDEYKWKQELLWNDYFERIIPTVENISYEIYASQLEERKEIPSIINAEKTVNMLVESQKSLARFGDNEFEIILGRKRTNYQDVNGKLADRLLQVLESKLDDLIVAIADNYGKLDKYTNDAAEAIRQYLGRGTRAAHMSLLDMNRTYYDAYLSRPYIIYRDKENASQRFDNIKRLWNGKDLLIVEGTSTRFGVGNDLINNAKSVERILTLDKNCFDVYDHLLECVCTYGTGKLIMIILGPVATVMAYDLCEKGFRAIDIGQLDTEYEWYLRGVTERCDIPNKTVSEVIKYDDIETDETLDYMRKYRSEVIAEIRR